MTSFLGSHIRRSRLLGSGALLLMSLCLPASLWAQASYPSRNITVINPWPPGGPADIVARPIFAKLAERLGQPVVIENKAGGGGVVGALETVKAAPDGYNLGMATVSTTAANPAINTRSRTTR